MDSKFGGLAQGKNALFHRKYNSSFDVGDRTIGSDFGVCPNRVIIGNSFYKSLKENLLLLY